MIPFPVHNLSYANMKTVSISTVLMTHTLSLSADKHRERPINLFSRPVSRSDPSSPSHAVTLPACTCQISLTSSAATPYDTPSYCPEPACHLTLHAFMRFVRVCVCV